jgi:hypothetical protein
MSVRLSCPSCNTAFDLDAIPADRRAACPRCGDVFPVRGELAERATGAPTVPTPATPGPPPAKRGLSRRRTVAIVVALGLVGFGVGFAVYYRGAKPKVAETGPIEPPLGHRKPLDYVSGIAGLPAECNVVFAIRADLIVDYAARTKQDPRELLERTGVPAQILAVFDQAGLSLADVNHIAGGAVIGGEGEELRFVLVVVINRPIDEATILKRLKGETASGKGALKTVQLNSIPVPLFFLGAAPQRWAFSLNERDLQSDKGDHLNPDRHFRGVPVLNGSGTGMRKWLSYIERDTAIWVAVDDDRDWAQKPLVKLAAQAPEAKKWVSALGTFRGGLFAINLGERPSMSLRVRNTETATAERLGAIFQANGGTGVLSYGDRDVVWDAPFDPATGRDRLQKLFADIAK